MESRNRNVWIVVIAILVLACCCTLMAMAAAGGLAARYAEVRNFDFDLGGLYHERFEQSVEVGEAPTLDIINFAGSITIRPGTGDSVHVVATKKASSKSGLRRIQVSVRERGNGVAIKSESAPSLGNASVALEITAPANSHLNIDTGAGTVSVRDITGSIDLASGAGTVEVRGARGPVEVDVGAGQITYEGAPSGACRFGTGAGNIMLKLPHDLDAKVEFSSGIGAVGVTFPVSGPVSLREVRGTIGDGSGASIGAHTGAGTVTVAGW